LSSPLLGLRGLRWNPWSVLTRTIAISMSWPRRGSGSGRAWLRAPSRIVSETSYGERRRPRLAMALAQKPKVLLLDEPLAGLSQGRAPDCSRAARQNSARRDHRHDRARHGYRARFAERITLLHYGEVIVEGTRAEVVADPRTREVYLGD
jgi:branched-chain amino acid transport system ATP-binding protein